MDMNAASKAVAPLGKMHITNVRLSYFFGFEPYVGKPTAENPNPKPKYTAHLLMAPDHPDLKRIAATIERVGQAKQWKGGLTWTQVKTQLKAQDKLCLRKGDVSKPGMPEYAGLYFLACNNDKRFTIIDGDRTPLRAEDGRPYSGCYANAIVDIYAQDNEWGRRINATITGVQFVRHGDSFGGGAAPAQPEEFGIVAESADEDAPAGADSADDLLG
jgi:hypothetical protein